MTTRPQLYGDPDGMRNTTDSSTLRLATNEGEPLGGVRPILDDVVMVEAGVVLPEGHLCIVTDAGDIGVIARHVGDVVLLETAPGTLPLVGDPLEPSDVGVDVPVKVGTRSVHKSGGPQPVGSFWCYLFPKMSCC